MKKEFIDAIESNDIVTVRLIISNELLLNTKGDTYREMKEYAEANVPDLYEAHDGEQLDIDDANLSVDLLVQLKNDLDSNFSRERIAVYERVAEIVLRDRVEAEATQERPMQVEQGKGNKEDLLCGLGLGVGGLATACGISKGSPLMTLIGAAAVTFCSIKLHNNKKNGK